jgi:hypothetical protein
MEEDEDDEPIKRVECVECDEDDDEHDDDSTDKMITDINSCIAQYTHMCDLLKCVTSYNILNNPRTITTMRKFDKDTINDVRRLSTECVSIIKHHKKDTKISKYTIFNRIVFCLMSYNAQPSLPRTSQPSRPSRPSHPLRGIH